MNRERTKWHAPLYEALIELKRSNPSSFHVPGHKYGQSVQSLRGIDPDAAEWMQTMMALDVTELSVTDDLHMPEGAIAEAENMAALTFGADKTFFLVGGSTAGNIAMLLAACAPGELVVIQRNVHKSVLNGLALAGAQAVFLSPGIDPSSGLNTLPALSDVQEALERYPAVKAVLLTNPSYYGIGADLEGYADLIHRCGAMLLVDEAHGAHYGLHPSLPRSALQAGADAVVQSTHKTLTALTLGAMLHVKGNRIDRDALKHALAMIQSSSPSYPIMVSLDIARAMIDSIGPSLFDNALRQASAVRQWIVESSKLFGLAERRSDASVELEAAMNRRDRSNDAIGHKVYYDPLRIVVSTTNGRLSGYQLQERLEQCGCWAEMADPSHVVLVIGIGTTDEDTDRLKKALAEIEKELSACEQMGAEEAAQALSSSFGGTRRRHADDTGANGSGRCGGITKSPTAHGDGDYDAPTIPISTRAKVETLFPPYAVSQPVAFSRMKIPLSNMEMVDVEAAVGRIAAEAVIPYPPGIPILYPGEPITREMAEYIGYLSRHGAKCHHVSDPGLTTIAVIREEGKG